MKKSNSLFVIPFLISIIVSFGVCQDPGLLSRVIRNYGGGSPLSTAFDVKILWKVREKEETKHGSILVAPHDRFRIALGDNVWVSDGTVLWEYDKSPSAQVIIRLLASCDQSQLPSRILSKYLTAYSFKASSAEGKETVFSWSADSIENSQKGEARRISFTVDSKKAVVRELVVLDKSGNVSTYTFHATTLGPSAMPRASAFSLQIPKGVRVLDERQ